MGIKRAGCSSSYSDPTDSALLACVGEINLVGMPHTWFVMKDSFVQYWNGHDVHDGKIRQVVVDSDQVLVSVETYEGRLVVFEFAGVHEVKQNRPEGMMLYSLSEMYQIPPLRRFVFANWDEEDDAYLEIIAREVSSRDSSP